MATISMISPQNAAQLVKEEKAILLDIRSVGETVTEHIPASLFLPFDIVNKLRIEELGVSKKLPVLVCRSGVRAEQAAKSLANEIEDVAVLDGGIVQWKEKGLPVTSGRKALPLDRQVLVGAGGMMMLFTILGLLASPYFYFLNILMAGGMVFAGVTGACGMARVLVMMPWNKTPLCGVSCEIPQTD